MSKMVSSAGFLKSCGTIPVLFGIGLAMLSALLLPMNLLARQPFHHDEALYGTWALQISTGQDVWLAYTPVDKPPLFIYIVAAVLKWLGATETAARLPSLLATALTVGLTFCLGQKLYNTTTGLIAAWLVALSPFTISFAPTALTDPLLTTFILASCLFALEDTPILAGGCVGLAVATKQQAVFFAPLVVGCYGLKGSGQWSSFMLSLAIILALIFLWDSGRGQMPSFLFQSAANYGGLTVDLAGFGERGAGFIGLLQYITASPILNIVFVVGGPCLLIFERFSLKNPTWGLSLFIVAFICGHAALSFQVWDRYVLGLVPLFALLGARLLWWPYHLLRKMPEYPVGQTASLSPWSGQTSSLSYGAYGLALSLCLLSTLAAPVADAVNGRYPLGSNSHALQGIDHIVDYLQGHVGANRTLYHHWLGTHWRFYLWGYPYDLEYWATPADLARRAKPGDLIAFPSWHSDTEARLTLAEVGLTLHELTRAYTAEGVPSIILYRID